MVVVVAEEDSPFCLSALCTMTATERPPMDRAAMANGRADGGGGLLRGIITQQLMMMMPMVGGWTGWRLGWMMVE